MKLAKISIEDFDKYKKIYDQNTKCSPSVFNNKLNFVSSIGSEITYDIIQNATKYIDRYKDREVIKTLPGEERVRVEEVIKYVENCPVPKELLDIHNNAARMNKSTEDKK